MEPPSPDSSLRIIEEKAGEEIRLIAHLQGCLDATVTVEATVTEASTVDALRQTVDSAGKPRFLLLRFQRKNKQRLLSYRYKVVWRPGGRGGRHDDSQAYLLPYPPTARYRVIQGYLGRISHYDGSENEYAVDWSLPLGTPVCAARAGVVVGIRQDIASSDAAREFADGGNYLLVRHSDGTYGEYLHLQKNGVLAGLGQSVRAGERIALSGNTGRTTGPHLHFAVFRNLDGRRRQTIPVLFRTPSGITRELREGEIY